MEQWGKQGVLLWNANLTCEINKPGIHWAIWKDFTKMFIKAINDFKFDPESYNPVVFVFMGKVAQFFKDQVNQNLHFILECPHPASECYSNNNPFVGCGIFAQINKKLKETNQKEIEWL